MRPPQGKHFPRNGASLLELLAVVTILGVITAVILPRLGSGAKTSQSASCEVNVGVIEIQAALWRRETGSWPDSSLSDVGASTKHFPEGKPACPVDGSEYRLNTNTGRVIGHNH